MKYRKKPVVVEAFQLFYDPFPDWYISNDSADVGTDEDGSCVAIIRTPEGVMVGYPGDYIIRGVHGELYPCKADIFEETYEEVDDDRTTAD